MSIEVVTSHSQIPAQDPGSFQYTAICTLTVNDTIPAPDPLFLEMVIDKSYSMDTDDAISIAKNATKKMISHIKDANIHVRLTAFCNSTHDITTEYTMVTEETIGTILDKIDGLNTNGGGGTNISGVLSVVMHRLNEKVKSVKGSQGYVVLLTDGQPNGGVQDSKLIEDAVYKNVDQSISIGAIALGDSPRKDFMINMTNGGKFFYAASPNDLNSAYEEVESGFYDVVRRCIIESSVPNMSSKQGSAPMDGTISLSVDLNHEQLMALPVDDASSGKHILKFTIKGFEPAIVEIPVGDSAVENDCPEITAHRQIQAASREIESAIQSASVDGTDAAIGRLVAVAENVQDIAASTPSYQNRSRAVQHIVRRASENLRSVRQRSMPPPAPVIPHESDEDDDGPGPMRSLIAIHSGEPKYRSCVGTPSSNSISLIMGEASSQLSNF